jgi:hypothetical protein
MLSGSWGVKLPSIIDDEYLSEGVQPSHIPSRMNLFVYSVQLFDIMEEILSEFYLHDARGPVPKEQRHEARYQCNLAKVLAINSKLDRFHDTIPEVLRPEFILSLGSEPWFDHLRLQSKVLNSRFIRTFSIPVLLSKVP